MSSRIATGALILIFGILHAANAHAQQAAERYIPIGESPGVSGEESVIGKIVDVDYRAGTMTVRGPDGLMSFRMVDSTQYYLDRSRRKRPNQSGSLRDCEPGDKVEVKYTQSGKADWVKIESR